FWTQQQAQQAGLALLPELCKPRALLSNLQIVGDPRLEFGDRILIEDKDGTGVNTPFWVAGIAESIGDGYVPSRVAKEAMDVGRWDITRWDECLWGDGSDGVWEAYVPVWDINSGTSPVLSNGTITGAYSEVGNTVFFRFELTIGSLTTAGSGGTRYSISLPVQANPATPSLCELQFIKGSDVMQGQAAVDDADDLVRM